MSDIAVKVEHLSKYYKLGVINNGTLFKDIQSFIAKKTGKEDPNGKFGNKHVDTAEGFWALKDLNFEIKKGDRIGIIGYNGAGKSTLLKVLSRITSPTEGSIKINGRVASLLEVGTGFHQEMTGRENIYMNGAILGMKKAEIDRKVHDIIEFSELGDHIDTPVKRYSSGMYVRLAFAVAAHLDSEILIADEVLAVGDGAFQKKALGKMNELSTGEGRTVLFVSHHMDAVKKLCNKGIVLEKGKLVRFDDDVRNSINWYLQTTENSNHIKEWSNISNIGNSNFYPKRICIVDKNKNIINSSVKWDEDFYVKMDYDVEKIDASLGLWFNVFKGVEMITSIGIRPEGNMIKGINSIYLKIKAETLIPNNEYIFVLGASTTGKYIVNDGENQILITVPVVGELKNINWAF